MSEVLRILRNRYHGQNQFPYADPGNPEPVEYLNEGGNEATMIDHNLREPVDVLLSHGGLVGKRGRDPHGQPIEIPAGVPGGPLIVAPNAAPKRLLYPETPPQFERWQMVMPTTVTAGQVLMSKQCGFPVRTIQVDNYTANWLYIPMVDRYIAPWLVMVQLPVLSAATNDVLVAADKPPGFVQASVTAGTSFNISAIESQLDYCCGILVPHP